MRTIIAFLAIIAAVAAVPANPQRIVGGSTTTINQYPSMAALLFSWTGASYTQGCGGSILNQRAILTAAHCTHGDQPWQWRVRVGSTFANSGGNVFALSWFVNHPQYNPETDDNDFSVLRISGTISYGNTIQPVSISGSNYNLADNQVVWAAGWGRVASGASVSETLRHVQVWTINQNLCTQRYASVGLPVTANMLCSGWLDVGGRDQCQGDSGGPLYHNGVVVGVCSWGVGCGLPFFPGVNARVSVASSWITSNA